MGRHYKSPCRCGALTETTFWDWRPNTLRPKCSKCGSTLQTMGKSFKRESRRKLKPKATPNATGIGSERSDFEAELETLKHLSGSLKHAGLSVHVSMIKAGKRQVPHVKFNFGEQRILDWWPSTGTAKIGGPTGTKTRAENASEAYALAAKAKSYRVLTGKIFPKSEVA